MSIVRDLVIVLPLLCSSAIVHATEIYRWVDEDGVVNFSDEKPASVTDADVLEVQAGNSPDYDPDTDPYSIRNQAARINKKYAAIEEGREERREKRREEAARRPWFIEYRQPDYRYHASTYYFPSSSHGPRSSHGPHRPLVHTPRFFQRPGATARRQSMALDELGLSGPRPHSINSGAHRARVEASRHALSTVGAQKR